jgi:hypothetical protein
MDTLVALFPRLFFHKAHLDMVIPVGSMMHDWADNFGSAPLFT